MAKHTAAAEAEKTNISTLPSSNVAPDYLTDFIAENEGQGVSTAQEDNLVPLIYVLQGLSPQVNKRTEAYIEDAEPGDLWLRNAPSPIVKGDAGLLFQPVYFFKNVNEWIPRDDGGGFVGSHTEMPADAREVKDTENSRRITYLSPRNTEYIETRNYAGYAITPAGRFPYLLPFSSTGHSTARMWMQLINQKVSRDGKRAPIFACIYKLTTRMRKNKDGEWFVIEVADAGFASRDDAMAGKTLAAAFSTGEKKAAAPDAPLQSTPMSDEEVPI